MDKTFKNVRIASILFCTFVAVSVSANKKSEKIELLIPQDEPSQGIWGKDAETIQSFKDLKIMDELSEENSLGKLEDGRKMYNISIAMNKNLSQELEHKKKSYEKEIHLEDKYRWQKKARENLRERELLRIATDGRQNALVYLIKGMNILEKIQNPNVRKSEAFTDLLAGIYREYIKHQIFLRNFTLASDMLERYLELGEKYFKEGEPHKLLAICYERQEQNATKYKKDSLSLQYKDKKNKHLLKYAELTYGKDSSQYTRISEKMTHD